MERETGYKGLTGMHLTPRQHVFARYVATAIAEGRVPSPKELCWMMNWTGPGLGGAYTKMRARMLKAAGYVKNEHTNRWVRP